VDAVRRSGTPTSPLQPASFPPLTARAIPSPAARDGSGNELLALHTALRGPGADSVGGLGARVESALRNLGFAASHEDVHYFREREGAGSSLSNEFVSGERPILADHRRSSPSDAVVYGLFGGAAVLLLPGVSSAVVLVSALLTFPFLIVGLIVVVESAVFALNGRYWSDFVLVACRRQTATTPARSKDQESLATGAVSVTVGRLYSQDPSGKGGQKILRLYGSDQMSEVSAGLRELLADRTLPS
jgi:hypothetical protein